MHRRLFYALAAGLPLVSAPAFAVSETTTTPEAVVTTVAPAMTDTPAAPVGPVITPASPEVSATQDPVALPGTEVKPVAEPAVRVAAAKPRAPIKDPAPSTSWPIAQRYYPTEVTVRPDIPVGSIIIVSDKFFLYHIIAPGKAMRYGVAVGRDELKFRGTAVVARKVRWPSWTPTPDMIKRNPTAYEKYRDGMPGGPTNPLGARALYLYQDGKDTAIRIHGTTEPSSIGHAVSNGCLRMVNDHVIALFDSIPIGTPVTVY